MGGAELTAILSFVGTIIGSIGGVLASSRLTNFRLQQLEEKVKLHNGVMERMAAAEVKLESHSSRIEDLEQMDRRE